MTTRKWIYIFIISLGIACAQENNSTLTCADVVFARDQCTFISQHCEQETVGYINYLRLYYCSSGSSSVIAFWILISLWLLSIFMTIGIAASEFLCPNLNTMGSILGLSESLLGVTFLAFGNGSPDLFSTYSSVKIGSGSLAIGELIGAASLITAVVTGSMALVRPFKVCKESFLRDLVFFICAILFVLYFLSDGFLRVWECFVMLGIYVTYVSYMVFEHWYRKSSARVLKSDEEQHQETQHDSDPLLHAPVALHPNRLLRESEQPQSQEEGYEEVAHQMRLHRINSGSSLTPIASRSSRSQSPSSPIRPSLLGALEFSAHSSRLSSSSSIRTLPRRHLAVDGYDSDEEDTEPLEMADVNIPQLIVTGDNDPKQLFIEIPQRDSYSSSHLIPSPLPHVACDNDGSDNRQVELESIGPFYTLFPTLSDLNQKPWYTKLSSIITAPSLFLFTISIPVFETDAIERESELLTPITPRLHNSQVKDCQSWLLYIQAIVSPLTVLYLSFHEYFHSLLMLFFISFVISGLLLLFIKLFMLNSDHIRYISFIGFLISLSWISTIANEVVSLIKAIGVILHISDAILGLTIFAIGNSLGDLVSNITIAKLGFPMMALSACFGGPMLNILVGVGVSCLTMIFRRDAPVFGNGHQYRIELSRTLIVSAVTLLTTLLFLLIAVPLNEWKITRKIAIITISFWVISTIVNVIVEIFLH